MRRRMVVRRGIRTGQNGSTAKTNVHITILDGTGKKIRNMNGPEEKGLNRVYWDFRHNPPPRFQRPGSETSFSRRFSSGLTALPGAYTVKIKYEDQEVSQSFKLLNDPRLKLDPHVLSENFKFAQMVQKLSTVLTQAEKTIFGAQKLIKTVREHTRAQKPAQNGELLEAARILEEKLKKLAENITPDTSEMQGITDRSAGLRNKVRRLAYAVGRLYHPLPQALKVNYETMTGKVKVFVEEFNRVFKTELEKFQSVLKEAGFTLFKPIKPLKVE